MQLRAISSFALVAILASPLAAQSSRHTISGRDVAIYNLAGDVRVEAGTGPDVVAEITRAGSDASQLRIESGPVRGRQTLRVIYPGNRIVYPALGERSHTETTVRDDGTFGDDHDDSHRVTIAGSGRGLEAAADMRVLIPKGQRAAIYLAVGKITVTNVDGDLTLDAASANVDASGTAGTLRIDVGSGSVRVTGGEGDIDIDTGSGDVALERLRGRQVRIDTGSGEVTARGLAANELHVDTGSGSVRLAAISASRASLDTGSGTIEIDSDGRLEEVTAETGSGDITIRAPGSLSAAVDIETSSGSIDSDFDIAITRREEDHIVGRIGSGNGRIRLESGSGDVRLVRK
ncbi:MAG: DUF4097 family beta strand repeat-containing protein [Gemmatimonadota bacterium]